MTIQEFSDQFDLLYNNIMSNQAPGLDEYEKSVFLTKAQDEIVKSYFNPKLNKPQEGFDGNEKRQIDFSMLLRNVVYSTSDIISGSPDITLAGNATYFQIPEDVLLYINEFVKVTRGSSQAILNVVPVSYIEYSRLMSKPFKRPLKNQAWRLITSGNVYLDYIKVAELLARAAQNSNSKIIDPSEYAQKYLGAIYGKPLFVFGGGNNYVLRVGTNSDIYCLHVDGSIGGTSGALQLGSAYTKIQDVIDSAGISKRVAIIPGPTDTISHYVIRYVARPMPIVLQNLANEGVSIGGGIKTQSGCMLDPILHEEILQRAVELAKAAYTGDLQSQIVLGQASETEKGIVTRQ